MFAIRGSRSFLATTFLMGLGASLANAQTPLYGDPRPVSSPGGFAGSELGAIYQQDVGVGYTASSVNRLTLLNQTVRAPYPGSGQVSSPRPRIGLGIGTTPASKPFQNYTPEPTVSPYLNLFREDFDGTSDFNYQTLVRPMLQQQQFNRQMQRQSLELASRMQSMAAQSDFNPQGSTSQFPTGHQTVFGYYGHYYPTLNVRRR
jgi:hypothetical protein